MRRPLLLLAVLCALTAADAAGQGGCDIVNLPGYKTNIQTIGDAVYVGGRTSYRCDGGVSFVSDSAVSAFGRRLLIGNVLFEDPDKTVRAARIEYEARIGLIVAQGDVTVVDKKTGNRIRAPQGLTYNKATRENAEARINVYTGRPHITMFGQGELKDTTDVDADRMEIVGERIFHGTGSVVIKRGTLNATAGDALLLENGAKISLWRIARIKGETYDLVADSIYGETESDEFKELRAFKNARLTSEELRVNSARLRILLDSGVVNRLIAVGGSSADPARPNGQATVVATDFNLTADSIDALAPGQKVEQVHAVGNAMGARAPDSLDLKLPELIRRDWLRGDTVIAFFVEEADSIKAKRQAAKPANDSSFERVIEKLIAAGSGTPATAMYRMREQGDTTKVPQVNYIAAKRIVALFKDGAVYDVDATEDIKGLYLQPKAVTTRPPGNER